jgi:hypothetical protein
VQEAADAELFAPTPELLEETRATPAQIASSWRSRFVDGLTAVAAALIGFAALMAGGFSRLGTWRPIAGGGGAAGADAASGQRRGPVRRCAIGRAGLAGRRADRRWPRGTALGCLRMGAGAREAGRMTLGLYLARRLAGTFG